MLSIDARIAASAERIGARWPQWVRGIGAQFARPLWRGLRAFTRLNAIEAFLDANPHLTGLEFVEGAMRHLDVRYRVDDLERQRIPLCGACVIYANHPLGGLDALALLKLVGDLRRDVRIVANDWLAAVEPLAPLLLPVRILGGRARPEEMQAIEAALADAAAVIIFPAGAVARLGWKGVRERPWRSSFLRFAAAAGAPLIPVRIQARNSAMFYAGAALAQPIGTALLPREAWVRRQRRIDLYVDRPLHAQALLAGPTGLRERASLLQRELLSSRQRSSAQEAIAHPLPVRTLGFEMARLDVLGETPDGKRILLARPGASSLVLRELARLRELSFRAVGEGGGGALDWDRYDAWYDQLILWDEPAQRVVGGYRLGRSADILTTRGRDGLYTASLFRFGPNFDAMLAQGLELGRSFVVPDYWGTRSLDYLWYGIGAYLRRFPQLRYLFGTVSISASLPPPARDALVDYYAHYYRDPGLQVEALDPYPRRQQTIGFEALTAEQAFALLRANLAALGAKVPVLYKQYTELTVPGGASFLAFGIDKSFSNAVDGLILLDLDLLQPRKRQRYLACAGSRTAVARS
jgi:putative hemolysin